MLCDPVALEQHIEQATIEPARDTVIDVLGHGMVSQACMAQAQCQTSVIAVGGFMIEQQRQPFGMTKPSGFVVGRKIGKSLRHAGQAELPQHVESWMFEHSRSLQW